MEIPFIDDVLLKLVNTHETSDPYKIAKFLGIIVIEEDLGEVLGYYNRFKRIKMIHINSQLEDDERLYTCSHELGHSILHPFENTPQLSAISISSELTIEKEADYFATNLLVTGDHLELYQPTDYEVLDYYGLPWHLKRYLSSN